ncbi:hypothetical protein LX36DRAFT_51203 [Colletotrichum falcatum]|nr:hypothetical protein LX36DRAFT_51203 [Colletotrichum falcatum]
MCAVAFRTCFYWGRSGIFPQIYSMWMLAALHQSLDAKSRFVASTVIIIRNTIRSTRSSEYIGYSRCKESSPAGFSLATWAPRTLTEGLVPVSGSAVPSIREHFTHWVRRHERIKYNVRVGTAVLKAIRDPQRAHKGNWMWVPAPGDGCQRVHHGLGPVRVPGVGCMKWDAIEWALANVN